MDLQRIVLNIADTGNSIQICVIKAETKWSREQIVCLFNSSTSAHLTLFPFMEQFQYFLKDPVKYDVKYQVCLSWLSFGSYFYPPVMSFSKAVKREVLQATLI
jgi:hypothetical protein